MPVYEVCGFDEQLETSTLPVTLTTDVPAGETILIAVAFQIAHATLFDAATYARDVSTYPERQPDVTDATSMNEITGPCVWMADIFGGAYIGLSGVNQCVFGGMYVYEVNADLSAGDIITIDYSSRAFPFTHPFKWLTARLHRGSGDLAPYFRAFESVNAPVIQGVTTTTRPLFDWFEFEPDWGLLTIPISMTDITEWYDQANGLTYNPDPFWIMGTQPWLGAPGFSDDDFNTHQQYTFERTLLRHTTFAPYYQDHGIWISYAFEDVDPVNDHAIFFDGGLPNGIAFGETRPSYNWGVTFNRAEAPPPPPNAPIRMHNQLYGPR